MPAHLDQQLLPTTTATALPTPNHWDTFLAIRYTGFQRYRRLTSSPLSRIIFFFSLFFIGHPKIASCICRRQRRIISTSTFTPTTTPLSAMTVSDEAGRVRMLYKGNHYLIPLDFVASGHPGGQQLLLRYINQDITTVFEKVGHSHDAVQLLEKWAEDIWVSTHGKYSARDPLATNRWVFSGSDADERQSNEELQPSPQWMMRFEIPSRWWNTLVISFAGITAALAVLTQQSQ